MLTLFEMSFVNRYQYYIFLVLIDQSARPDPEKSGHFFPHCSFIEDGFLELALFLFL
ncbi:MAG: hypothetical protein JWO06_3541 [Bacteroidota bacterium]|nr:hypothetical protein [Bacteroidota bacterium]